VRNYQIAECDIVNHILYKLLLIKIVGGLII